MACLYASGNEMVGAIFGSLNHVAANAMLATMVNAAIIMVECFINV
jgi:hypothetical protein